MAQDWRGPVVETRGRMKLEYLDTSRAPCYRSEATYVRATMYDGDGYPRCKPEIMEINEYYFRFKGVARPKPTPRNDGFLVLREGYG